MVTPAAGDGVIELLLRRRSIARLTEPAPSPEALDTILRAAAAAPDHGELRPWRFVVLAGEAKDAFGEVLAEAYDRRCERTGAPSMSAVREKERTKLGRAPMVVVVGVRRAVADENPLIPWDDVVGAGYAACQNALLAATAVGYGSYWRSGDITTDPLVLRALGFAADDFVTGFLYLGTPHPGGEKPPHDPVTEDLISFWSP